MQIAAEDIVGGLDTVEIHNIKFALLGRRRLNWIFDPLKVEYPDWPYPAADSTDVGGSNDGPSTKRKKETTCHKWEW